jgi:hypothetical protein
LAFQYSYLSLELSIYEFFHARILSNHLNFFAMGEGVTPTVIVIIAVIIRGQANLET